MDWIKKNWLWLIIAAVSALPLIEAISSVSVSFSGGALTFSGHIPEEITARFLHSGRPLSPWGRGLHQSGEWASVCW